MSIEMRGKNMSKDVASNLVAMNFDPITIGETFKIGISLSHDLIYLLIVGED